jgi:hypothetical protein
MLYPLVRFSLNSRYLTANLDVVKGPALNLTVLPESRVRFTGEFSMNYYRSIEDLNAECALWYRFFDASHPMGDFMGAAVGFKNMGHCFALEERGKFFELQYRSFFACFDLSFLKLKGGYVFDSRTYYDEERNGSPGKGWFVSVNGIYQF